MFPCRDREDLIQFLERVGFRLRKAEVAEYPTEDVPGCVPGKGALRFE